MIFGWYIQNVGGNSKITESTGRLGGMGWWALNIFSCGVTLSFVPTTEAVDSPENYGVTGL